uniref:cAMP-responsive element-binding protein-like 2 n=1 Tax=Rattus norvegicus TaxID=10116 RepID=A0ABK0M1H6_RAT
MPSSESLITKCQQAAGQLGMGPARLLQDRRMTGQLINKILSEQYLQAWSPWRSEGIRCPGTVVGGKVKKPGKRGRKPAKIDLKAKLERSRQSARECRARKKLRYQYLEELVSSRERAICALREELEMYKQWCMAMDQGKIPSEIRALLTGEEQNKSQQNSSRHPKAGKTDANTNSLVGN